MSTLYDRITEFNKGRLPDMLLLKYKAMSLNAFSFFRGTCHLFYQDLSKSKKLPGSPLAWICGDLHLENFGSFKGDNRMEYFDLNDFDEAGLAPALWEIARIITSILVEADNLGLPEATGLNSAQMFLNAYSATLKNGKSISVDPRTADGIVKEFLRQVEKRKQKDLLKKLSVVEKGHRKLIADGRHFPLDETLKEELITFMADAVKELECLPYRYEIEDVLFRLAGTGSVGAKRYVFLLRNLDIKKKYLLIDMKQALPSSLAPYLTSQQPAWTSDAQRVIVIQKRMQNVSPALLSAVYFKNDPYVLKQLQPLQDKINFELLKGRRNDIQQVIKEMAILTASAQLRSSGRQNSAIADELVGFGENSSWQPGILKYASACVSQVKKDYAEFLSGYNAGLYGKNQA